jgi:hypothetical protein
MSLEQLKAERAFFWLVGILEGEGTFVLPSPAMGPSQIVVEVNMTDFDTVEQVAKMFGSTVRPVRVRDGCKPAFRTSLSGERAAQVMRAVKPYMCKRRQERITRALEHYTNAKTTVGRPERAKYCDYPHCFSPTVPDADSCAVHNTPLPGVRRKSA